MAKVKGMFFTIGLSILMTIILSLAIATYHNAQKTEGVISQQMVVDRLYSLDSSIQNSLKKIFFNNTGITISSNNNILTIRENLPNSNSDSFSSSTQGFESFVESNYKNINLNTNQITSELPLMILPHNITYKHNSDWDQIQIIPSNINNVQGYSLKITAIGAAGCSVPANGNLINLTISATGAGGSSCSFSKKVDPTTINLDNGLNIEVTANGGLSINAGLTTSTISTQLLLKQLDDSITVSYPENTININFPEFGISKSGVVRIF